MGRLHGDGILDNENYIHEHWIQESVRVKPKDWLGMTIHYGKYLYVRSHENDQNIFCTATQKRRKRFCRYLRGSLARKSRMPIKYSASIPPGQNQVFQILDMLS